MTNEGNYVQDSSAKRDQYFGSFRNYYSGLIPGSTSAYTFIGFSGTNTGFGTANNILSNRITIVASGGNARAIDFQIISGILGGEMYPGEAFARDGVSVSGIWIRSSEATGQVRIWGW